MPSYTLVDAALHYDLVNLDSRLKGMRLSVNATYLFDKIYVSQCTVQLLDNACVYGLRRQVLASLRYSAIWMVAQQVSKFPSSSQFMIVISVT